VGNYVLSNDSRQFKKQGSFGNGPNYIVPSVITRCNFKSYDNCFECDEVLKTVDYYRTVNKIPNPIITDVPAESEINSSSGATSSLASLISSMNAEYQQQPQQTHPKQKWIHANLCRKCYCKAMHGKSKFWNKNEISKHFRKTRHCSFIHEHNNIPEFTHKTNCKQILKLRRKENIMAKYYSDRCDRISKSIF
jgi:hypothetical protein